MLIAKEKTNKLIYYEIVSILSNELFDIHYSLKNTKDRWKKLNKNYVLKDMAILVDNDVMMQ